MNKTKYYVLTNSGILDIRDVRDCHLKGLGQYAALFKLAEDGRIECDAIEVKSLEEQLYELAG